MLLFPEMKDSKGQRVTPVDVEATLASLEALEDAQDTISLVTNPTGDSVTESVVIDSVDFTEITPPSNASGRGGIAYITLRTVA